MSKFRLKDLKNVDGSGEGGLTLEDGSNLFIDFTTSTQDI